MKKKNHDDKLKLVLLPGANKFGLKVHENIQEILGTKQNYILQVDTPRFNIGEGKGKIPAEESARNAKVFILQDVANSFVTYPLRGLDHPYSPDDHYQDIIRAIGAIKGHAKEVSVIMPILYQSRQHKAMNKESRDCAISLQELVDKGVKRIITFDIHNEGVLNAIPLTEANSIFPTNPIMKEFVETEDIDYNNLFVVSPDTGAVDRSGYWRDVFECDSGYFDKVRDRSKIVDGKNPIKKHVFVGGDLKGKTVIFIDDMIDSGGSILSAARHAKEFGAKKVYIIASFVFFSRGYKEFDQAYEEHVIDKIYSTNLTFIPDELDQKPWFKGVDCSRQLAEFIIHYYDEESLAPLNKIDPEIIRQLSLKRGPIE